MIRGTTAASNVRTAWPGPSVPSPLWLVLVSGLVLAVGCAVGDEGSVTAPYDLPGAGGGTSSGQQGGDAGHLGQVDPGSLGTGGTDEDGCAKVDFLFVVDNSPSMSARQDALIASFPGFMGAIEGTLQGTDHHIMVVDTDDAINCPDHYCAADVCSTYACQTVFDSCDSTIGAGVIRPAGAHASNMLCPVAGGHRYMVEGQPDLADTFSCLARVGTSGQTVERPIDSLRAAVSVPLNDPSGCNAGFLRDDAILVVTFISDDPNYEDADTPADWYDDLVQAKGGNAEAIVVLGLTPSFDDCFHDWSQLTKGAHWSEFIALWGSRGLEASVCSPSYTQFFQQAVSIIDDTCDNFVPPPPR
ncbi:MAG: hypothetical protein JRI23_08925 [Deltaproteobacteria bacterium]|jgi:hypothetical protein|nr:hypothetical protein [Deltaproteobacteria bacterium]MBW2531760.1 hypothetical protein [Deltaproteobacteria bacterium]